MRSRSEDAFSNFTARWNIARALSLIHKPPRALREIDVALFAHTYGFPFVEGGSAADGMAEEGDFFYVDKITVMSEQIDLVRQLPIALIAVEGVALPSALLIDRLHRLIRRPGSARRR